MANEAPKHGISLNYIKSVNAIKSNSSAARKGGISLEYISGITGGKNNSATISVNNANIANAVKSVGNTASQSAEEKTAGMDIESGNLTRDTAASYKTAETQTSAAPTNHLPRIEKPGIKESRQTAPPDGALAQNFHAPQNMTVRRMTDTGTGDFTPRIEKPGVKEMPRIAPTEGAPAQKFQASQNMTVRRMTDAGNSAKTSKSMLFSDNKRITESNDTAAIKWRIDNGRFNVNQAVDWEKDPDATKVSTELEKLLNVEKDSYAQRQREYPNLEADLQAYSFPASFGKTPKEAYEEMISAHYPDGDSPYKSADDFFNIVMDRDKSEQTIATLENAVKERVSAEGEKRRRYKVHELESAAYNSDNFTELAQKGMQRTGKYKSFSPGIAGDVFLGITNSRDIYERYNVKPFEDSLENPIAYIEAYRDEFREEKGVYAWTDASTINDSGIYTPEYFYFDDNQKMIYSYYVETEGRAKADEYMQTILPDLQARRDQFRAQNNGMETVYKWAAENDAAAWFLSVPANLLGGASSALAMMSGEKDKYSAAFLLSNTVSAMRQGLTSDDSEWGALLSNTGMSIMDSLLAHAWGPAAPYIMGGTAAGNAYSEALQNGTPQDEALAYATLVALIEWGTENISFAKLTELAKSGKSFTKGEMKQAVKAILAQSVTEGLEEVSSSYATTLMDISVRGDNSDYKKYIQHLVIEEGMDYADAVDIANYQFFLIDPLMSFGGGFISGGVMSTGAMGANTYANYRNDAATAQGTELAGKVNSGEKLSVSEKKKLIGKMANKITRAVFEQETGLSLQGDFSVVSAALDAYASGQKSEAQNNDIDNLPSQNIEEANVDARLEELRRQTEIAEQTSIQGDTQSAEQIITEDYAGNDYADALETARMRQEDIYGAELVRNAGRSADVLNKGIISQGTVPTMHKSGVTLNIGKGQTITSISIDDIAEYSAQNPRGVSKNIMSQIRAAETAAAARGIPVYLFDGRRTPVYGHHGEAVNGFRHNGPDGEYIAIDINADAPLLFVFGHELFHAMGKESEAKLTKYLSDYLGEELSIERAADKLGECLCDPAFCEYLVNKNRTLAQRILDFIKRFIAKLKGQDVQQLNSMQRTLANALNEYINSNRERNGTSENSFMSIAQIVGRKGNYGHGVVLDTDFFKGVKPRDWSKKLCDHVYKNMAGTQLTVYDDNGKAETITLAKANDRVKKEGANNSHKVLDKLARTNGDNIKALGVLHIDELANTSRRENIADEHSHQWLDENGWEYRKAYAMDSRGNIYEVTLNIARGRDRNILYAINNIRRIDDGVVPSAHKGRGSHININPSDDSISNSDNDVNNSFMYAGQNAKTANVSALETAKKMERKGTDSEKIRRKTGWHKGYDGEWRFEIDDSELKFNRQGNFTNPDVERMNELYDKFLKTPTGMSQRELEDLRKLEKTLKGVKTRPSTLGDYITHDALFSAYPQLRNMPLKFERLESARGYYATKKKEIVIDERLKSDEMELKETLAHEIQHAVQNIEGFASGSSPEYWERTINYDLSELEKIDEEINEIGMELESKFGYDALYAAEDYLEGIEANDNEYLTQEEKEDRYETADAAQWKAEKGGYFDLVKRYADLNMKRNRLTMELVERSHEQARENYKNTAGEIEARDASFRMDFTSDMRKDFRPDIDRKNVVFVDRNESSSANSFMSRSSLTDIGDGVSVKKVDVQAKTGHDKIDSYTRKQYNDFGWVNVNKILTGKELNKLYRQFANIKKHNYRYPMSVNKEYMIAVGDKYDSYRKIVYIKGSFENPRITQVLSVSADVSDNDAANFIDEVIKYEQRGHDNAYQIIAAYEGKEIFRRYTVHDCIDYSEHKSGKQSDSRADNISGRGSFGERSDEQGSFAGEVDAYPSNNVNSFMSRSSLTDIGDGVSVKKVDAETRAGRSKRFAAEYDLINRIAKRTRTKVQYVSSITQDGKALTGGCYYHRASGTLYLNVNSDKALSGVFYRGLLHHIAETNSKGDNAFVRTLYNYVREYGKQAGWKGNVIAQINEALNGKADTSRPHGAFEEVLADKVSEMFEDENFMRYVSRRNMTFLQKLWENIKSFIIRSLGGTYTPPSDVINAKTAEEIIGKMSGIQVLVADALDRQGHDRTRAAKQTAKELTKTARKLEGKYAELNGEAYNERDWQEYDSDRIEHEDITASELRERVKKMPSALLDTIAREMGYTFKGETATARRAEFTEKVISKLHPEDIVSVPNMPYKEGDISPLTTKAQKQNISALKKTGSIKTVRKYGYQNVADGVMVCVTDPSTVPLSNAHADNLAAGKSLAGALGFERIGYYTGEIRNANGKEVRTESRAIIGKDGTLYINLNADSPYTAIVGASWFENLRKTNIQTAVALIKAYDRYRKLTRSKADISQWIGKQLTGTQTTALFTGNKLFTEELANLMHMDASSILEVIESDPQFSSLIARGDLPLAQKIIDSIKGFFTRFGDTIARMTGNTDRRAASALTIAQKNLLIAMKNAPLDGARAMRAEAKTEEEYRRIQNIEREIERIDRLEAERERAAQQERADRRRDYYEELDRQEAEKKRARESRRKWNWGDVPDGEGGGYNSFMSRSTIAEDFGGALTRKEWREFYRILIDENNSAHLGGNAIFVYNEDDAYAGKLICYKGGKKNPQVYDVFSVEGYDWTIHDGTENPMRIISKEAKNHHEKQNDVSISYEYYAQRYGLVLRRYIPENDEYFDYSYLGRETHGTAQGTGTGTGEESDGGRVPGGAGKNQSEVRKVDNNSFMSRKGEYPSDDRRALTKGEMKNEFYDVLNKSEWASYYRKINKIHQDGKRYKIGDVVWVEVSGKIIRAEMHDNGEFSVVTVYTIGKGVYTETEVDYYGLTEMLNRMEERGYEQGTVRTLIEGLQSDDGSRVFTAHDRADVDDGTGVEKSVGNFEERNTPSGEKRGNRRRSSGTDKHNLQRRIAGEVDSENKFMSRKDDGDSSGLGSGFDDLNADNADAVVGAIGRFEQNTEESQTLEAEPEPAPIINEDPEVRSKYQELRDRFGTIPQGEDVNSRGDVGVPSRTQKNNRVRQGVRTFAEAKATPDEVVGELEREIVNGTFSYTPLSDKAANNYAKEMIEADPEEALREWDAVVRGTKPATKKQIALAENLIMEAAALGDTDTAVRLIAEVAAEGTRAGQAVQAFRMIKKLSPMGQLYSLQKAIDKLNRENENRNTKKIELPSERLEDYAKTVTDLEDLQRRIAELEKEVRTSDEKGRLHDEIDSLRKESEQKKKAAEQQLDDLKDDVAEQMPKKWTEKLNAWRYLSMLGNPRTHIRNILGNAVFKPTVDLKSKIAAIMEAGVKRINPNFERSQSLTAPKAIKEFAVKDAKENLEQLANGGKYNASDEIRDRQKVFSERNIVGRALNKASEFNSRMLEVEDAMFLRKRYAYALAHYIAANKWNIAHLNANPQDLQRAREFAFREAQRATYRDMNAFSQFLSQASNKLRDGKGFSRMAYWAMEGAMPFKKTPANIIKRGVEYSPIGLLNTLTVDILRLKRGEITGAEYINNLAAGMTGTMILGLGYLLASLGILRGRNKDKEDEFEKLRGAQEWSMVIGDFSYTIDWLAPMSLPLFVGVELYDQTANSNDKMDMQDLLDSLTAISEPIFSLSMMDGVQSLLQSYSSEGAISDMFISALQSYAGQMTPTILGQFARTFDDTSRNAYYNDKTLWWSNTIMQPLRGAASKIPGLEEQLPARVDAWGRTTEGTTTFGERFVQNFISPGYWSFDKTTSVDKEIQKIFDETGDESVFPKTAPKQFNYDGETYYLGSDEYVTFAIDRGQTAYAIIEELTNTKAYKSLSAKEKAEAINKAYDISLDYAKGNTDSGFDAESNKAIKAFNESGVEYSDYILFTVLCQGTSQADAYKALNKMRHLTDAERAAIWNTKGWKASYEEYKAEH